MEREREAREERRNYGAAPAIEEVLKATEVLLEGIRNLTGKGQSENPEIQVMEERVWKMTLDYVQKQFPLAVKKEPLPSSEGNVDDSKTKS